MGFSLCLSKKRPSHGPSVRLRWAFPPAGRGKGHLLRKEVDFTLRPPEVGPNCPLYKFKGSHQRDTRTASCAQDIGFVKERYPDVAQILGLVKHRTSAT